MASDLKQNGDDPSTRSYFDWKVTSSASMGPIRLIWASVFWPAVYPAELETINPLDQRKILSKKSYQERQELMEIHDIVGDVIECTPQYQLRVEFPGETVMDHGNIIDPRDTLSAPNVIEWPIQKYAYYTLSFVGPDYPSRETRVDWTEWNHWLIGNIEGQKWSEGESLADYIGPHLLKGKGFHRYVMLVYRQPVGRIKFNETHLDNALDDSKRANFSIREFAVKYGMGSPIAGNFFFTP